MKSSKWIWIFILLGVLVVSAIGSVGNSSEATSAPTLAPTAVVETFKVRFTGALIVDKNQNGFSEAGEGVAGEEIYIMVQGTSLAETTVTTDVNGMFESEVMDVSQLEGIDLIHALAIPRLDSCAMDLRLNKSEKDGVQVYDIEILLDNNCHLEGERL